MSELGSISVKINGDASGLISAASTAQNALASLTSAVNGLKSSNVSVTLKAVDNATPIVESAKGKIDAFGTLKSEAKLSALDNTASGVASAQAAVNSVQDRVVTITVRVNQQGSIPKFAHGTMSAPKGLARINDERGISDPRELIYHDGSYYMFEGQNVLLPLDRGDRVYTASQTKNIMRMNGIKSYASGKNNEFFEADKRLFTHSTKTSNMPVSEQISWWNEAMEKYAYDSEVVMECSEEIFALTKKLVKEINGVSETYVEQRSKLNDWEKFGDTALDAFARIKNTQTEYLNNGTVTWDEYCNTLSKIGANMYEERIKHSENWLNQELKYNEMSIEKYIEGLDRMAQYTQEYYNNGLIGDVDYFYGMQSISNKKADMQAKANAEEYKAWQNSAQGYLKQRNIYGDWERFDDNNAKYYERCIERQKNFFDRGTIDWDTYNTAVISYRMELYKAEQKAAQESYNNVLSYAKNYVSNVKAALKEEKNELNYKIKKQELDEDFAEAYKTKSIYKNAVTQKGQEIYEKADKKILDISREKSKLALDERQTKIIANLESSYKTIEANKSLIINRIMNGTINTDNLLKIMQEQIPMGQNNICSLLSELLSVAKSKNGGTDNRAITYNITSSDAPVMRPLMERAMSSFRG